MATKRSRLVKLRKANGWTQEALAVELGVDRATVGRWERGGCVPDPLNQLKLAKLLKTSIAELVAVLEESERGGPEATSPAEATSPDRGSFAMTLSGCTGADLIRRIRMTAIGFQEADRRVGGGLLYPAVQDYLNREIAPHLLSANVGTTDAAMLFSAAASMTEIAGWMSHDGGENKHARSFFDRAFRLASAAENDALAGNTCASMAHLAIESGQHADALRIAYAGLHRAAPTLGAIRLVARLHAMRARAFAVMGDNVACARELDVAEIVLTRADAEPPADWIADFDEASLASEAALCFLDLADFAEAERRAAEVIRLRSTDRVRSRAFGQLTLARVLVGAGRLEEAARLGQEVCRTAESLSSVRVTTRLNDLGRALRSAHDVPEVARFIIALKALSGERGAEGGQVATWPV